MDFLSFRVDASVASLSMFVMCLIYSLCSGVFLVVSSCLRRKYPFARPGHSASMVQ